MVNNKKDMNAVTWLIYCAVAAFIAVMTRNPLYLVILLLILWAVFKTFEGRSATDGIWSSFIRLGVGFIAVSIVFNAMTAHYGRTVLFRIPVSFPVIGGSITAEAVAYGLAYGLVFISMVSVFAVFNTVIDLSSVLRLVPGFMRQSAILMSITFNFIPQTLYAATEIKEAQKMRGYTMKSSLRDIAGTASLFVPLIITGLEKSCTLAESMESRAYGSTAKATVIRRPLDWTLRDILTVASSLIFAMVFIYIKVSHPSVFAYSPYPQLAAPGFDPLTGMAFLLMLVPVVMSL